MAANNSKTNTTIEYELRPAIWADEPFLLDLFVATHLPDFAHLEDSGVDLRSLLALQYSTRRNEYQNNHPHSVRLIVLIEGEPAGSIWIDENTEFIEVLDIALVEKFQNRGIGAAILTSLLHQAADSQRPVRLAVLESNHGALRLYHRLGFEITDANSPFLHMEWGRPRPASG